MMKKLLAGLITGVIMIGMAVHCSADMLYHYEGTGIHIPGFNDYVSVDYAIYGVDSWFDLKDDQSYKSYFSATYTTDSNDLAFDTVDTYSGLGTARVDDRNPGRSTYEFIFPQNALPDNWGQSIITYEYSEGMDPLIGWSASPYNYWSNGSLTEIDQLPNHPVPEPTTLILFSTGLAGLIGSRLKRRKKSKVSTR